MTNIIRKDGSLTQNRYVEWLKAIIKARFNDFSPEEQGKLKEILASNFLTVADKTYLDSLVTYE